MGAAYIQLVATGCAHIRQGLGGISGVTGTGGVRRLSRAHLGDGRLNSGRAWTLLMAWFTACGLFATAGVLGTRRDLC
jgi:hypothetical protein